MGAELPASFIAGAITVPHGIRPDFSGRAKFGDLLKEVVVRIEEETETRRETVHRESARDRPLHILHSVPEREGKFLYGCGSGFAYMITANGNWVEARNVLRRIFDYIRDQAHRGARRKYEFL